MTTQTISKTSIGLHWAVAVLVIVLLCVGIYMHETKTYALYPIHKSFGVIALLLASWRFVWRMFEGFFAPAGEHKFYEQILAKITHWLLLIGSVLMPLSGVVMSVAGGKGLAVFGISIVAPNFSSIDPTKTEALNKTLAGFAHSGHGVIAWVLIAVIALHVLGALKHHIIDKDATLRRMFAKG